MSTVERARIPRAVAETIAAIVIEQVGPSCERVEVAGSIRRRVDTVKDIEIVAVPKLEVPQVGLFGDLFGDTGEPISLLKLKLDALVADGFLYKRMDADGKQRWGNRHQRALYKCADFEVGIDFFAVIPPAQWGVIFAIRTGSAEFSRNLVTQVADGGMMPSGLRVMDGALWRVNPANRDEKLEVINTPKEADVFRALGWHGYPPPEQR